METEKWPKAVDSPLIHDINVILTKNYVSSFGKNHEVRITKKIAILYKKS